MALGVAVGNLYNTTLKNGESAADLFPLPHIHTTNITNTAPDTPTTNGGSGALLSSALSVATGERNTITGQKGGPAVVRPCLPTNNTTTTATDTIVMEGGHVALSTSAPSPTGRFFFWVD